MNHVSMNTRLKNYIFVGNGFILVPDFFVTKQRESVDKKELTQW